MCHVIIWTYSLCPHADPDASTTIHCQKALQEGYECIRSRQTEFNFPIPGRCQECKYKLQEDRLILLQTLRTRDQGQRRDRTALDAAFELEDEEWYSDSEGLTESEIDLNMPAGTDGSCAADKTKSRIVHRVGPARKARLVIPTTPIVSYSAAVETGEEDDEIEEPVAQRGIWWRSWLPLPTRLLVSKEEPVEKKSETWKSAAWGASRKGWIW